VLKLHIFGYSKVEAIANKPLGKISHKYLQNAIKILNLVKEKYTSGEHKV